MCSCFRLMPRMKTLKNSSEPSLFFCILIDAKTQELRRHSVWLSSHIRLYWTARRRKYTSASCDKPEKEQHSKEKKRISEERNADRCPSTIPRFQNFSNRCATKYSRIWTIRRTILSKCSNPSTRKTSRSWRRGEWWSSLKY